MRRRRGHATLAGVTGACTAAVAGLAAALLLAGCGGGGTAEPAAATTGEWAPLTVTRPKVPEIGGGIPVDIEPAIDRTDLGTTLSPLPGEHRFRLTVFNTSNVGAINAFQWYPPLGVRITKLLGSSAGRCVLAGLTGFGGNQFPGVVLNPNILCDRLDLKAPTCMCRGDGGELSLSVEFDKDIGVGAAGDFRMREATVSYTRIPLTPDPVAATTGSTG